MAALSPQKIAVCTETEDFNRGMAVVFLERLDRGSVRIDVADELTNKRVSRDIAISRGADGSAALSVAVAADELLRATWAELSLRKNEESTAIAPPSSPLAPAVEEEKQEISAARVDRLPALRMGIAGVADVFVDGSPFFGGDLVLGSHFGDVIEWSLFGGPRATRQNEVSSLGGARAIAASWGGSLAWPVARSGGFVFGPVASLQSMYAWYSGTATDDGPAIEELDAGGWSLQVLAGATARMHLDGFYMSLGTQWGGAVRGFEVTDGRGVLGGMRGFLWSSTLGMGGSFGP